MNLVMLPMWILSGVFFSATRFPAVIQPFVRALPLTAAIDALRGNMLQGIGLNHLAFRDEHSAGLADGAICSHDEDFSLEIDASAESQHRQSQYTGELLR